MAVGGVPRGGYWPPERYGVAPGVEGGGGKLDLVSGSVVVPLVEVT